MSAFGSPPSRSASAQEGWGPRSSRLRPRVFRALVAHPVHRGPAGRAEVEVHREAGVGDAAVRPCSHPQAGPSPSGNTLRSGRPRQCGAGMPGSGRSRRAPGPRRRPPAAIRNDTAQLPPSAAPRTSDRHARDGHGPIRCIFAAPPKVVNELDMQATPHGLSGAHPASAPRKLLAKRSCGASKRPLFSAAVRPYCRILPLL